MSVLERVLLLHRLEVTDHLMLQLHLHLFLVLLAAYTMPETMLFGKNPL